MKNIEILGIVNAYTEQKDLIAKAKKEGKPVEELKLPAAIAWKRRVNLDKLFKAKTLIDEALKEIQQSYADDEHSEEIVSETGEKARAVKPIYQKDFLKEQGDILTQDTEVDIKMISIEDIADLVLSDEDMDTLSFMIKE